MYTRLASLSHSFPSSSLALPTQHDDTVEQVSLAQMNSFLQILAEMFPAHQICLLRALLLDASPESRLFMAANALIENKERYAERATRLPSGQLEDWEKFRSTEYRVAVEKVLYASNVGIRLITFCLKIFYQYN